MGHCLRGMGEDGLVRLTHSEMGKEKLLSLQCLTLILPYANLTWGKIKLNMGVDDKSSSTSV